MAALAICTIETCDKPVRVKVRGLCRAHYLRLMRTGSVDGIAAERWEANGARPLEFLEKTAIPYCGDTCLDWPFARGAAGYGRIRYKKKYWNVHRLVCRIVHGEPPSALMEAAHNCGNRACVNPHHLRWDSHKGNMADTLGYPDSLVGTSIVHYSPVTDFVVGKDD
ncbi:MAG: HNH endonuclease [Patescibacteria group bacterium]|nr:HNH endonuclease [Patescibacteria group bacterium]